MFPATCVYTMAREIRILIADDHPLLRQGLRQAIEADARFGVVAEASNGRAALDQIQRLKPQIAVLDIDMPDMDGFAVVRELRAKQFPVDVIFLTVHRDERFFSEALQLGTKGYVLKDSAVTDIVSSIGAVAAGEHFTSPALTSYLVKQRRGVTSTPPSTGLPDLTSTERRVLALIADYKTSREIGELLHISHRTVQTHRANICIKLDLHGSHALMKFALDHRSEL
jgi:DNA-binding NarL/FixJ family response regulator